MAEDCGHGLGAHWTSGDDLCVRRDGDGDGAWGGEEEARIRQDARSIAEKDDRATVLGSDAAGPSP